MDTRDSIVPCGTTLRELALWYKEVSARYLRGYPKKAGFIHLPYTPEIASRKPGLPASLPLSTQARAVVIAVEEAAASPTP